MKKLYIFKNIQLVLVAIFIVFALYVYCVTRTVPADFPIGKNFIVDENESLYNISIRLEQEHYIYSARFFRIWVSSLGRDRHISLGVYTFDKPYVLGGVVKRFVSGNPNLPLISVTIPEGSTSSDISHSIEKVLPKFSSDVFAKVIATKSLEGMLFPSTYFLLPSYTEERIVQIMKDTFDKKYKQITYDVTIPEQLSGQGDVVILASILEGEAKTREDMQLVAGILLRRLSIGMALQVDAAKSTYTTRGLPKVAINNPGENALYATVHPTYTPYLYYVTGKDGTMHYAKTFDEHKKNIKKYL
jgi:UPF0755 protein